MKKKFELICWLLFTVFSAGCLFINFMSEPPVDDVKKFTIYMLLAAGVSVLYPAIMFALGLRNSHLYEQLNADAEQREALETEELKHQREAERRAAFSGRSGGRKRHEQRHMGESVPGGVQPPGQPPGGVLHLLPF